MQAIVTKYVAPNNQSTATMVAKVKNRSVTIKYEYPVSMVQNHILARAALIQRLGWGDYGDWAMGQLPNGDYAHCLIQKPHTKYEVEK